LRTIIYVDGFNLYYRALKNTPYKWLNLNVLFKNILNESNEIELIRYFTARISGKKDPDQPRRQQIYLEALTTIPYLSIHYGKFLVKQNKRPISGSNPQRFVLVDNFEEKGSDVNLASYLIHDGWKDLYDVAVVVTSDTDLIEPIKLVRHDLKKTVGLISPSKSCPKGLESVADFRKHIRKSDLNKSMFPEILTTSTGKIIRKPSLW